MVTSPASDSSASPSRRSAREHAGRRARARFPRRLRILRRADFDTTLKAGVRVADGRMTLWGRSNESADTRLGVTVGRKHGGAVQRNRIKRLLREAFRLSRRELPAGLDLVCAPRATGDVHLEAYMESFVRLAARVVRRLAQR